jgi:hypothetical protein
MHLHELVLDQPIFAGVAPWLQKLNQLHQEHSVLGMVHLEDAPLEVDGQELPVGIYKLLE